MFAVAPWFFLLELGDSVDYFGLDFGDPIVEFGFLAAGGFVFLVHGIEDIITSASIWKIGFIE
jgi:hypothetical protein